MVNWIRPRGTGLKKSKNSHSGYNIADYVNRLRLMREIEGATQQEFADRLEMDMRRWNNYERGFPMPRDVVFSIMNTIKGPTPDWLWFGYMGNLTPEYRAKVERMQTLMVEQLEAEKQLEAAQSRVKLLTAKRRGNPKRQPSRR